MTQRNQQQRLTCARVRDFLGQDRIASIDPILRGQVFGHLHSCERCADAYAASALSDLDSAESLRPALEPRNAPAKPGRRAGTISVWDWPVDQTSRHARWIAALADDAIAFFRRSGPPRRALLRTVGAAAPPAPQMDLSVECFAMHGRPTGETFDVQVAVAPEFTAEGLFRLAVLTDKPNAEAGVWVCEVQIAEHKAVSLDGVCVPDPNGCRVDFQAQTPIPGLASTSIPPTCIRLRTSAGVAETPFEHVHNGKISSIAEPTHTVVVKQGTVVVDGGYEKCLVILGWKGPPARHAAPATATVPRIEGSAFERTLRASDQHNLASGMERRQILGNALLYHLFDNYEDSEERWNDVGRLLFGADREDREVVVWICVDDELADSTTYRQGYLPLECLNYATETQLTVIRGAAELNDQFDIASAVDCPWEPLRQLDSPSVLLVHANPPNPEHEKYPHLTDLEDYFHLVWMHLERLEKDGRIELHVLQNSCPSSEDMEEALRRYRPNIFVFMGHGDEEGLVCVHDGEIKPWPIVELVGSLGDPSELRLAALIACRSWLVAPALVKAGVASVVGIQPVFEQDFSVEDVPTFADSFLKALFRERTITRAFQIAQRELSKRGCLPAHSVLMPSLWLASSTEQFADEPDRLRLVTCGKVLSDKITADLRQLASVPRGEDVFVDPSILTEGARNDDKTGGTELLRRIVFKNNRVQVVGPSGAGKTSLLLRFARSCLARGLQSQPSILLSFDQFAEYADDLAELFQRYAHSLPWPIPPSIRDPQIADPTNMGQWLFSRWKSRHAILILEDAHATSAERRAIALEKLREFPGSLVVVSSQPTKEELPGFEEVRIRDFDWAQTEFFIIQRGAAIDRRSRAAELLRILKAFGAVKDSRARPGVLVGMLDRLVKGSLEKRQSCRVVFEERRNDSIGRPYLIVRLATENLLVNVLAQISWRCTHSRSVNTQQIHVPPWKATSELAREIERPVPKDVIFHVDIEPETTRGIPLVEVLTEDEVEVSFKTNVPIKAWSERETIVSGTRRMTCEKLATPRVRFDPILE